MALTVHAILDRLTRSEGVVMAAYYYHADTESGDHLDDPSEDALFDLITRLTPPDNTFITIEPADEDPAWYASVALLDDGTYEVERRDAHQGVHEVTTETD